MFEICSAYVTDGKSMDCQVLSVFLVPCRCMRISSFKVSFILRKSTVIWSCSRMCLRKWVNTHDRDLQSYLTVRVCRTDKSTCLQSTSKISPGKCFLNHFNLISYFISFALCDWNTFSSFKCILQWKSFSFLPRKSYNSRPSISNSFTPPQCFDLMTGLTMRNS